MSAVSLAEQVRARDAGAAASGLSGAEAGVRSVTETFGYRPEQLAAVPDEIHLGLFGLAGMAIGVDMTAEMVGRANASALKFGQGTMPANVEFGLGRIESLPLEDASVNCQISNCVINLVPDQRAAFREMYRVLGPGGRVALSDVARKHTLPEELARSVAAYVGCVAGTVPIAEYERLLREAGFADVHVVDTPKDRGAYAKIDSQFGCCDSSCGCDAPAPESAALPGELADLIARHDINEYAASVQAYTLKA